MLSRSIFKAYDVRGLYPQKVNEDSVKIIARALSEMLETGKIVIAHDGRHGSADLARVIVEEIKKTGVAGNGLENRVTDKNFEIISVGLATTPMFYFLVNHFAASGGAMVTASHNPKEYNGIKAVRAGAVPISGTELLAQIDKQNGL